jgi:SAM-dependent methyltransferase
MFPRPCSARRGATTAFATFERPPSDFPSAVRQFDLVAAGLAFHWFDCTAALSEIRRVLRPGGFLLVFNARFRGTMRENGRFAEWHDTYLQRFPAPPRNHFQLSGTDLEQGGFRSITSEPFAFSESWSLDRLGGYLTTQSNVTSALLDGREIQEVALQWLQETLRPLFREPVSTFDFDGTLLVFERTGST